MNLSKNRACLLSLWLLLLVSTVSIAGQQPAAIASAHPLATEAGQSILEQGGNAFDAAIAVSAVLAVVEPYSSGIGGGGFYLLQRADSDRAIMLDARERAPLRAHAGMYLDDTGEVVPGMSINGAAAAAIPGLPAAFVYLAEHYGQLPLSESLAPAIQFARQGFTVDDYYQRMVSFRLDALSENEEASRIFLADDVIPPEGHRIVQHDLADTLALIAEKGFSGFYENDLALKMVRDVRQHGGIWTMKDLATYRVKLRTPEVSVYKGMKVTSAALPSSGGLVLAQIFAMLSRFDLESMTEAERVHHIVEAMRRAYRDRAEYMGDPDYVDVPVDLLVSESYIQSLVESIDPNKATLSDTLKPVVQPTGNGQDTTHFSIIDADGNRVSATLSVNYPFGACFVAKGTGVLLNDEMDDFVAKPGVPNVYGLVGSTANAIEPGKRMLSSMTPSFAETGERMAIIGTPGGSRIITMVLLGILDFYDGKAADDIVNDGRYHHQYLPDAISYEPGALDDATLNKLQSMGHELNEMQNRYGNMQAIIVNKTTGEVDSASDERGIGSAWVGK